MKDDKEGMPLESLRNWLVTRSGTAWAKKYGYESLMLEYATHIDAFVAQLAEARSDAAAVRELMNVYNLGGWTDAIGPMKRALSAEARLDEVQKPGYVMVPEEPDTQMMIAGSRAGAQTPVGAELIYKAMLSAAPRPEGHDRDGDFKNGHLASGPTERPTEFIGPWNP